MQMPNKVSSFYPPTKQVNKSKGRPKGTSIQELAMHQRRYEMAVTEAAIRFQERKKNWPGV